MSKTSQKNKRKKFTITAQYPVYLVFEVEASSQEEAKQRFLNNKAVYITKDNSYQNDVYRSENIVSVTSCE